jgi:hypothetical protein
MTSPKEHAALTVLVRRVDSPTTATCWRRRPMPRYRVVMRPRWRGLQASRLPLLLILNEKPKPYEKRLKPAAVLRIMFPWYIDAALMKLV